jgi:hypothetical protein
MWRNALRFSALHLLLRQIDTVTIPLSFAALIFIAIRSYRRRDYYPLL